jgi:hypothetical protein
MANLLWSLLCEKPLIDSQSNQISLIGIIEQLNVPKVPIIIPQLYFVVCLWEKDNSKEGREEVFKHRIQISPQSETYKYTPFEYENTIPSDKMRLRTCNGIRGIPVSEPGKIIFSIEIPEENDWKSINIIEIVVKSTQ